MRTGWPSALILTWTLSVLVSCTAPAPQSPGESGVQAMDQPLQGVEVLTRGVLHEAFAAPVVHDPKHSPVVSSEPPEPIEEMPPEQKPAGDDVAWIPGYWTFDEDRDDFVWVSGIWRRVPPEHEWVPGYWHEMENGGFGWIPGYWRADTEETVTYHPDPPASLEAGPGSPAPSESHVWVSGVWMWGRPRFLWQPGYWVALRPDWVWVPATWVWTPFGCVFTPGYWDYHPWSRGVVFAPCYVPRHVRARPGFTYRPRLTISLAVVWNHCFVRPRHRHYYFGDYYRVPPRRGIVPWHAFHGRRLGYDPLFVSVVIHRNRRNRDARVREMRDRYAFRRSHSSARPPRTWRAQRTVEARGTVRDGGRRVTASELRIGRPLEEARREPGARFEPVPVQRRTESAERAREARRLAEQRRGLEASRRVRPDARRSKKPLPRTRPEQRSLPRSPIRAQPGTGGRTPTRPSPSRRAQPSRRPTRSDRRGE